MPAPTPPPAPDDSLEIRGLAASRAWDHENAFYWFSSPSRLNKLLAHYELYKSIVTLPGDVVELGVYKGTSLLRLATFRAALENDGARRIVGFDAFGPFPTEGLASEADTTFVHFFESVGGPGLDLAEMETILARKGFGNLSLVKGNVLHTLPRYVRMNPALRIAFLHLDMDVGEPTALALDLLFDRVVPGGLVVIDDYNAVAGATDVVDAFARERGLKVEKLPLNATPAFIRKSA